MKLPAKVDLRVEFRGGWLTEFYPDAKVNAPGVQAGPVRPADHGTKGSLDWKGLQVGKKGMFPETQDAVWLAPAQRQMRPRHDARAGSRSSSSSTAASATSQPPL